MHQNLLVNDYIIEHSFPTTHPTKYPSTIIVEWTRPIK